MKNYLLKTYLFIFLLFLSSVSFGQNCYVNLEGTYNAKATVLWVIDGIGWALCEGNTWEGKVRWSDSTGMGTTYRVFSLDDSIGMELEDMTMGTYYACYYPMNQGGMPNGNLLLEHNTCDELTISGTDQWGAIYTIIEQSVDSTATILTLKWVSDYQEGGKIVLTRTDGLLWTDGTSSISKTKSNKKQLTIFPNPATDMLHLKTEKDLAGAEISIFSLHGKVLLQKTITSPQINLSTFEKGIYFLEVNDLESGEVWMKKLIVE